MKSNHLYLLLLPLTIHISAFVPDTKNIVAISSESTITYRLHHPMHEIEAVSKDFYCEITVDPQVHQITKIDVEADVTTFDSGNSNRDSHAMEVIDALDYPEVSFISHSVTPAENRFEVGGILNFHGRNKEITITVEPKRSGKKTSVTGVFKVSLTEFGIDRPALLMIPVDDSLAVSFSIVFPEDVGV